MMSNRAWAQSGTTMENKMIEGQSNPLDIAKRVLSTSTLRAAARTPYTRQGWKILDRWAMNSPEALKALEAQGEVVLLGRLLEQQTLETKVLEENQQAGSHMAEHEILSMHQVETELA